MPKKTDKTIGSLIPTERIEQRILVIRGQKVMLDSDLAELYGVPTKRLNEQVKRNSDRFPEDFMFQLTAKETEILRSQIATSSGDTVAVVHRPMLSPNMAPSCLRMCSIPSVPLKPAFSLCGRS